MSILHRNATDKKDILTGLYNSKSLVKQIDKRLSSFDIRVEEKDEILQKLLVKWLDKGNFDGNDHEYNLSEMFMVFIQQTAIEDYGDNPNKKQASLLNSLQEDKSIQRAAQYYGDINTLDSQSIQTEDQEIIDEIVRYKKGVIFSLKPIISIAATIILAVASYFVITQSQSEQSQLFEAYYGEYSLPQQASKELGIIKELMDKEQFAEVKSRFLYPKIEAHEEPDFYWLKGLYYVNIGEYEKAVTQINKIKNSDFRYHQRAENLKSKIED